MKPGSFSYSYPKAGVTADCVVFGFDEGSLKILLIRRAIEPFLDKWALPGGFIHHEENAEACARRILLNEAGLKNIFTEQLYTFSDLHRDPRGQVISIAYYALIKIPPGAVAAGTGSLENKWYPVDHLPRLAFDHSRIVKTALQRLKSKVRYQPIGFELLPEKFTLTQLQHLYETILETTLDKRNFRKKMLAMKLLTKLNEKQTGVAHKAAAFYRFDKKKYDLLSTKGFNFEL